MGPLRSALINEYIGICHTRRRMGDQAVMDAMKCLQRIAIDSGFRGSPMGSLEKRGLIVVAQSDTDEAAIALGSFCGYFARSQPAVVETSLGVLCHMRRPLVAELLVRIRSEARNSAVDIVEGWMRGLPAFLARRAEPLSSVLMQQPSGTGYTTVEGWEPEEYGYRLGRSRPDWAFEGWIRSDGSTSLGMHQVLELGLGELVFESRELALGWAEARDLEVLRHGDR